MELILSTVIGLCFFIVPMWAYRKGLKDGLNINSGKKPEPIKSPVQIVREYKEAKETKAEHDKVMQGMANILAYDGNPQKEVDE